VLKSLGSMAVTYGCRRLVVGQGASRMHTQSPPSKTHPKEHVHARYLASVSGLDISNAMLDSGISRAFTEEHLFCSLAADI
jgi:hypothetical protein